MKIVIITYKTGIIFAFKKDNPQLLQTLINDYNLIEEITEGELLEGDEV